MLFLIALALVMIALAATGLSFERSLALGDRRADHHRPGDRAPSATASATATSPALARAIFCVAMIVGRMEALVIIALFNPAYWRAVAPTPRCDVQHVGENHYSRARLEMARMRRPY